MRNIVKVQTAQGETVLICPPHITSMCCTGGVVDDAMVIEICLSGGCKYQVRVLAETPSEALVLCAKSFGLA